MSGYPDWRHMWDESGPWRPTVDDINTLLTEIDRLTDRGVSDVDTICHYRNLAIVLGAAPEQMTCSYDRGLVQHWQDHPNDPEWLTAANPYDPEDEPETAR